MRNDEHTFSEIVRTYQKPLYWYIRRIVGVHEDAEDILQNTFARAYDKLWTLRDEGALKPWLFRIATNEVNRHYRKSRHRPDPGYDVDSTCGPEELISDDGTEDMVLFREAEARLPGAIAGLSLLQREVFCLKYYEEMDYDQISVLTGKSKNCLRVSYHQAKKKIKMEIL